MSARSCPRLFEVEAVRDGRLTDEARTRVAHHLRTCSACAAEARDLDAVDIIVRELPWKPPDALAVRRQRQSLVTAFSALLLAADLPTRRSRSRLVVAVAGVAAVFAVVLLAQRWLHHSTGPAQDDITIVAQGAATWSRSDQGAATRVQLDDGELTIRVTHGDAARNVRVVLPDGELTDVGTTFSVRVRDRRTTAIAVLDGAVALRIVGAGEVRIGAGESWNAMPEPVASPVAPSAATASVASAPLATLPRSVAPANGAAPPTPRVDDLSSKEFGAAVKALNDGRYDDAASSFGTFAGNHALDARAEDAAYLRMVALQRGGHSAAAREAAREYLRLYPRGFRRVEAEALAR